MLNFDDYTPGAMGFATFLIDKHGDRLRYALDTGRFYKYTGAYWHECNSNAVEVREIVGSTAKYLRMHLPAPPEKESPEYKSWAIQTSWIKLADSADGKSGVVSQMRDDKRLWCYLKDFSHNPYLLNFKDCTINVRKPWLNDDGDIEAYMHEHAPSDMLATMLSYSYPAYDEQATPLWDDMLLHMCGGDEKYAESLEKALAYGLLGENPEQLMVFLIGEPNIGKTQVLEVVTELAGNLGGHGKVELIQWTRGNEHDSVRADLRGKHFVMLGETSHRLKLDEMKFKDLTGAKAIPTRKLGQEPVDTRVTWTLYCATNELPEVPGEMDDAIARRLWLFPLPGKQIPKSQRDPRLTEKIILQEGQYLLYRFARHLSEWYAANKSPDPHPMSIHALDSYRAESNTVAEFCQVSLNEQEGGWVSYDDLNIAYAEFCKKRHITGVSRKQLPKKIEEVMLTAERDSKHMRMRGISVNFEAPSWL